MTTESETPKDRVEQFLKQRREADARRVNPLIAGQMNRPATSADLVKAAEMGGGTNRVTPSWLPGVRK